MSRLYELVPHLGSGKEGVLSTMLFCHVGFGERGGQALYGVYVSGTVYGQRATGNGQWVMGDGRVGLSVSLRLLYTECCTRIQDRIIIHDISSLAVRSTFSYK